MSSMRGEGGVGDDSVVECDRRKNISQSPVRLIVDDAPELVSAIEVDATPSTKSEIAAERSDMSATRVN